MRKGIMDIWESVGSNKGLAIILIVCAIALIFSVLCFQSWVLMLLWNWIAAELLGLPTIGFWLAFIIRMIIYVLFHKNRG